jgi:hypothetical protein
MTALVWSPLSPVLGGLSFFPVWVRPWGLAVILLAGAWLLLFRSGAKFLLVFALRSAFVLVLLFLTLPLAVEYVGTQHRRSLLRQPSGLATAISVVAERFCFTLSGMDRRLASASYAARKWPKKTLLVLGGAGVACWILFASVPALATPSAVAGQAYGWWREVEVWAQVDPGRVTNLTPDPVPVMQLQGSQMVLSTTKTHNGDRAVIWLAEGGKPLAAVTLDKNGTAKVGVTNANRGSFARGRIFRVEVGRSLVYLRLV